MEAATLVSHTLDMGISCTVATIKRIPVDSGAGSEHAHPVALAHPAVRGHSEVPFCGPGHSGPSESPTCQESSKQMNLLVGPVRYLAGQSLLNGLPLGWTRPSELPHPRGSRGLPSTLGWLCWNSQSASTAAPEETPEHHGVPPTPAQMSGPGRSPDSPVRQVRPSAATSLGPSVLSCALSLPTHIL